ncbi:MAG: GNAT family N-acetyltransferase [Bacteroidales bacterium]|nr:GNAT family N-acetyltransferase [Bacteroidales bacterium]
MENNLHYQDIYLRALEPEDLDFLYQIENDSSIWQYGANKAPVSRFCLKQYLENSLSQSLFESGELRLVIVEKNSGESLGLIDLFELDNFHARASIGIVIKKKAQGKSYGSMALKALCQYAKNSLLLHQLSAQIADSNKAALRLFYKCGFSACGMLKDWIRRENKLYGDSMYENVAMLQLILSE